MASSSTPTSELFIPNELLEDCVRGTCVIVVGSGLSANAMRLPVWGDFIRQIKDAMPHDLAESEVTNENIERYRLEYLDYAKRRFPAKFTDSVRSILRVNASSARAHQLLADLPSVAIITTNLDTLIEDAIRSRYRNPIVITETKDIPQFQEPHRPLVIKMHGSVESNSQVLTLSEYQDFDLHKNAMKALVLSYLIRHPVLIIGAGLTDPNFLKLYSIVHDSFGRFHHPAFYVHDSVPRFVQEVWEQRNFHFIPVPRERVTDWMSLLAESVKAERQKLYAQLGITVVTSRMKAQALLALGEDLRDYLELQRTYTTLIHMPDYCCFTDPWEQSLYSPLRESLAREVEKFAPAPMHLVYLAPGSHAPALTDRRLARMLSTITLMDIDMEVVRTAAGRLGAYAEKASINEVTIDFTAGIGQKLCDVFTAVLANEPGLMLDALANPGALADNIIREQDIASLSCLLEQEARQRGFNGSAAICFSEMVASFTGTAVLMAFRTELYRNHASQLGPEAIAEVMNRAGALWRLYNDRMFKLHLEFLSRLTIDGGMVLVAVDTEKEFDDRARPVAFSFSREDPPLYECASLNLDSTKNLYWRDHAFGFSVSVAGIAVCDFDSHRHRVKLYVYEKRS